MRYGVLFVFFAMLTYAKPVVSQEPDFSAELPRIPATEAVDALGTFAVLPPFKLELAAAEPLVASPVAMAFDENGRLYLAEMRDYSEQDEDFLGTIRLLTDTDGDGVFDDAKVFAKELSWPTAVCCWDGGVFVGAPPHLFYLKDTTGDGVADVRKTVFTGFSRGNVQGMMNSLRWGLDNRIHGAGSSMGGTITSPERPDMKPVTLGRHDFAFDPVTLDFEVTTTSAQHGMSFDDWGHKFICSNSNQIQQVMFKDELIARNPYLKAPGGAVSIAADGPQGPVFRTSPVEPWRIVRTRLRVAGLAPGPVEFGGKVSGYFSSATGVTIYRGDAWPAEWQGSAIIGDVGSNLIHRKKLDRDALPFVAKRVDENVDFVTSTDTWFRPVQFENGPDGALYVADFYRETIEHPKSLPESIKKHLDLTSGRDRGRIWRIVPEGFSHRPAPKLADATTAELVALLTHPNAWHRETASRLIHQRQDQAAIPLLEELARSTAAKSDRPHARGRDLAALGRLHALFALDGLDKLQDALVAHVLRDPHARVRENAVALAMERFQKSPEIRERLSELAADPSEWVRYQTAFALGGIVYSEETPQSDRNRAVAALSRLLLEPGSRWMRIAALSSLSGHEADVLSEYGAGAPTARSPGWSELAAIVARRGKTEELGRVADRIEQEPNSVMAAATLETWFADPTPAVRKVLADESRPQLRRAVTARLGAAKETALDSAADPKPRLAALSLLRLAPLETAAEAFDELADGRHPPELQRAAVELLSGYDSPAVADRLIAAWTRLSPSVREIVAESLTSNAAAASQLLDAIEAKRFDAGALPEAKRQLLREHPDPEIRQRSATLLAGTALAKRDAVVKDYRSALSLPGDAAKGAAHFKQHCAVCPNLAAIHARGAEFILLNVLDPSREVNPEFVDYTLVTTEGVVKTGMIKSESPTAVTLQRAEGVSETVLRLDIDLLQSTGRSLMPDGLEKQLDQQAMADVIAYLMSLE